MAITELDIGADGRAEKGTTRDARGCRSERKRFIDSKRQANNRVVSLGVGSWTRGRREEVRGPAEGGLTAALLQFELSRDLRGVAAEA
jgi:hypothetical protein